MSQPPRLLPGIDSKRWAQRAAAVPFGELAAIRATAEQWRNGLAGLVTLLSAGSLIASPALASRLTGWSRLAVGVLALCGLLTLLYGTWRAMDAAFGAPGEDNYLTGERLRTWEHDQANAAVTALRSARRAFIVGLLLTIAAAATAFGFTPASGITVRTQAVTGTFCGQLGTSAGRTVSITGSDGTVHTIPIIAIRSLQPAASC
jgi:hypothetical protein